MERYRSGHNGADSKSVCAKAHEGSNPSLSAKCGFKPRKEAAGLRGLAAFCNINSFIWRSNYVIFGYF